MSAAILANADAQMAKEGRGEYRSARSATVDMLKWGSDRMQINFDETGAVVEAPQEGPLHNASLHTMGTIQVIDKQLNYTAAALWTHSDGDQIFGDFKGEGALGVGSTAGFLEIVGSTARAAVSRECLSADPGRR